MRLKNLDLIGSMLIVAINVGWSQLPNHPLFIGMFLAVPLVLLLPGYTVCQVLFHQRSADQLPDASSNIILKPSLKIGQPVSIVDHFILSLGLSMAIDVLVGFILNIFPIGLQMFSWIVSLGLVTTVFALLALYLRRRDSVGMRRKQNIHVTNRDILLFGLAIVIGAAAVWFSVVRPPATQAAFTQFWALPSNQSAHSCAVRIGVNNMESTTMYYRVVVTMNGDLLSTWPSIVLAPQQEWQQFLPITPGKAKDMLIEAQLFQADKPGTVYRSAHVTFHSLSGSKEVKTSQCEAS